MMQELNFLEISLLYKMLKPRIVPCLLFHNGGLYKTKKFKDPKYVGDPLNAVRIFNEKNVDELVLFDIDCSLRKTKINFNLLSKISRECRMPICYGGGVKTVEDFEKIISLGIEKVSLSSALVDNLSLIQDCANRVGSQSVVVTLDILRGRFLNKKIEFIALHGTKKTKFIFKDLIKAIQDYGAGEIILNFIERDGTRNGYDFSIIDEIYEYINIPMTVIGGANSYMDFRDLFSKYNSVAAGAGSIFVFKGKFDAVLIQYPTPKEKEQIINF